MKKYNCSKDHKIGLNVLAEQFLERRILSIGKLIEERAPQVQISFGFCGSICLLAKSIQINGCKNKLS